MVNLFKHQQDGVRFLLEREGALLAWEMGVGKTRTAVEAANKLFEPKGGKRAIDFVLVLCPKSVKYSWDEELHKLAHESSSFAANLCAYDKKEKKFVCTEVLGPLNGNPGAHVPIAIVGYPTLQKSEHVENIIKALPVGSKTLLIADESTYLKNRTAQQSQGAQKIAKRCKYRWLLTGTPITNSPLDLWGQGEVMYPDRGKGPLYGLLNWFAFRSLFADLQQRTARGRNFTEVVGYKNLDQLQKRFKPFTSRVTKFDCLDLPPKSYTVRTVALSHETWRIYKELKRDALLSLGGGDSKPEPNAATRLLRLAQLTSGHVGLGVQFYDDEAIENVTKDVSSEKLDWFFETLTTGELAGEAVVNVWCRWRRERERLRDMINNSKHEILVCEIFGGQTDKVRAAHLLTFQTNRPIRRVLLAQPQAGGFGLNLTCSHTSVYLSNVHSWAVRAQSEDRTHRTRQNNACLYVDVIATGPEGQRTVDSVIRETLLEHRDLADLTCEAWRKALRDE